MPMMWANNSNIMGADAAFYYNNPYAELSGTEDGDVRTYTMRIFQAELTDEGTYECQIPGRWTLKQAHKLTVNSE